MPWGLALRPSILRSPVFRLQSGHTIEFTEVVCNENQLSGQGVSCNQAVEVSDRLWRTPGGRFFKA